MIHLYPIERPQHRVDVRLHNARRGVEQLEFEISHCTLLNARSAAVHRSTLAMYPKGVATGMQEPPFSTLEPSPRFKKTIEASGG